VAARSVGIILGVSTKMLKPMAFFAAWRVNQSGRRKIPVAWELAKQSVNQLSGVGLTPRRTLRAVDLGDRRFRRSSLRSR
jgi:hypothetical protein